jgi:hypothetical protein
MAPITLHPTTDGWVRHQLNLEPEIPLIPELLIAAMRQHPTGSIYQDIDEALAHAVDHLLGEERLRGDSIVLPRDRSDPRQMAWNRSWNRDITLWDFSDEPSHPYHFWQEGPLDTVAAVGVFQGMNIVSPDTQQLVLLDYDARQKATETVFGAVILESPTQETFFENFLALRSLNAQRALVHRVGLAESQGQMPPGRALFARELFDRGKNPLSWDTVEDLYHETITELRNQPGWINGDVLGTFDWLLDPAQYDVVHRMWVGGQVASFQANLFAENGLAEVDRFLRARGRQLDLFYLSDPHDLVPGTNRAIGQALHQMGQNLVVLPWKPGARVQTTFHSGIPEIINVDHEDRPTVERRYKDPYDPRYAYVEMGADALLDNWLQARSSSTYRPDTHTGQTYFANLDWLLRARGVWMDGKMWILSPRPVNPIDHADKSSFGKAREDFDPRPRGLKEMRQLSSPISLESRQTDLHQRRLRTQQQSARLR